MSSQDQTKTTEKAPMDDLCCLTRWYFVAAQKFALEDMALAQTITGLPRQFLDRLAGASMEQLDEISSVVRVLPFMPRLSAPLLMRLLEKPADVADALVIHGLSGGIFHADSVS